MAVSKIQGFITTFYLVQYLFQGPVMLTLLSNESREMYIFNDN